MLMPQITFMPVAPGARLFFSLEGEPPLHAIGGRPAVQWAVRVEPDTEVRLSVGGKLNDLSGYIHVDVGDSSPQGKSQYGTNESPQDLWGTLRIIDADEYRPATFLVSLHVSQQMFDRLVRLAELGRPPSGTVHFPRSPPFSGEKGAALEPIKYAAGWDMDASDIEWDNKTHPEVEITWCSFSAELGVPEPAPSEGGSEGDDDKRPELTELLPPTRADVAAIHVKVEKISEQIGRTARTVQWVGWLIVILLVLQIGRALLR
jgi:hypothetical protein